MTAKEKKPGPGRRKKQYSAPALDKGLDILELLAREVDGLSQSEIAKSLNRSVGELFRMLVVLEERQYVTLLPGTDKYVLTLKMFELSHRFPLVKRLTSAAVPVLKDLANNIEQSCHLVIYYEGKGHVIVQQDSPSERMVSIRLGAEAPLVNTCSGHLLLAFADEPTRNWMVEKIPANHEKPSKRKINALVKRVIAQGYESLPSAQISGVQDIAYPIFDNSDQIAAVLAVPFVEYLDNSHPVSRSKAQSLIAHSAAEISKMLGSKP